MKINFKNHFFLFGGTDLEMVEIKKMLVDGGAIEGEHFADAGLKWGAKLSVYNDMMHLTKINVAIELPVDADAVMPEHFLEIDHHNENSARPSSIAQVATLLGIELTHYQKLVAANDTGYIPQLVAVGATQDEIDFVRAADRAAQGTTVEQEAQCADAIKNGLTKKGALTIVKTQTSKFSPITDTLFGAQENLLCVAPDEWCIYSSAEKVADLKKKYGEKLTYSGQTFAGVCLQGDGSNKKDFDKMVAEISASF